MSLAFETARPARARPSPLFRALDNLARSPSLSIPRPGRQSLRLYTDRVRARPALSPTLSGSLGVFAVGLGLVELFAPHAVTRFLGMKPMAAPLVRVLGVREIVSGYVLMADPT